MSHIGVESGWGRNRIIRHSDHSLRQARIGKERTLLPLSDTQLLSFAHAGVELHYDDALLSRLLRSPGEWPDQDASDDAECGKEKENRAEAKVHIK